MKMSGERIIPAPQSRVWEALNDPDVLRRSIPGCTEMVKHSPTEFSAKVMAKVGPVKANFSGDVSLSKLDPPHSYLISGKGAGGVAGFAEGGAEVRLEDLGGETRLLYDVDARVGGKLAQIGSRLIDSTARRMADDFFNRFAEAVTSAESAGEARPETLAVPAEATERTAPVRKPPAGKSAAMGKPAPKKTAAKKSAAAKPGRSRQAAELPPPMPKAAAAPAIAPAMSPLRRDEPARPAPQSWAGENIWWLVGLGGAALLIIFALANL